MSRLHEINRIWRAAVLVLLLAAFIGPWVFDQIVVPAEYTCSPPNIRLHGDYCGLPMSGLWLLSGMLLGGLGMVGGLFTGVTALRELGRVLLIGLVLLLVMLPFFTTWLLTFGRDTRRRKIVHLIGWGLAAVFAFPLSMLDLTELHPALWGIWLYRVVVIAALALEILDLIGGSRLGRGKLGSTGAQPGGQAGGELTPNPG